MNSLSSDVFGTILLGAFAFFVLFFSAKKGFFSFEGLQGSHWRYPLRWFHVVSAFFLYFFAAYFLAPIIASFLQRALPSSLFDSFLKYASWMNLSVSLTVLLLLIGYLFLLPKEVRMRILKKGPRFEPLLDIKKALLAWVISFPLVLALGTILELILTQVFHYPALPEQLAVSFLKMTFDHPLYFSIAVITIAILAPLIEETLFRGFLQSFIRQHLGTKYAIFLSSLCFSFFHFSYEQGVANIPIIASLFTLALFLGFLYEKRGSLVAPMVLHSSFNTISIINLYFLGGFPKGPL